MRPPVPTRLKELKGTLEKSRLKPADPEELLAEIPHPPNVLNEEAQRVWLDGCSVLFNRGMLHTADLQALARYCKAVSDFWRWSAYLEEHGEIMMLFDEAGNPKWSQIAPEVNLLRMAAEQCEKGEAKFGFNPSARVRLPLAPKKKESKLMSLKKSKSA